MLLFERKNIFFEKKKVKCVSTSKMCDKSSNTTTN